MPISNESPLNCPFCHTLLLSQARRGFHHCPNVKCRFNVFVPGNRVVLPLHLDLGIGTIIKVQSYEKKRKSTSLGWISLEFDHIEAKESQNQWEETSLSKDKALYYQKYFISFTAYFERGVFLNELRHYLWQIGEKIKFRKNIGIIIGRNLQDSSGLICYEVKTTKGQIISLLETDIEDTIESPLEEYNKGHVNHPYHFFLHIWGHYIKNLYTSNSIKVVTNSRLTLMPHQVCVASHLLQQGFARYILADEVGLGKTIEAGIYIKEMMARKLADRILIISPASILSQWEFELENKFNISLTRLNSKLLKKSVVNYQSGCFLDKKTGKNLQLCSVSLQFARLEQCAREITKIEWDVVIIDEAHHLRRYLENRKTDRYRTTLAYDLAEQLSKKTKSLLLLTATPIQLHSFDLFSLIQLLNPYQFPNFDSFEAERRKMRLLNVTIKNLYNFSRINTYERNALIPQIQSFEPQFSEEQLNRQLSSKDFRMKLAQQLESHHFLSQYVIRNRRRKVFPQTVKRIPHIVEVELTPKELSTYNQIHQYLAKIYSENFTSAAGGIGFVMVILQKLLTSSVPAVLQTMKKRIRYLEENKDVLIKLSQESEKAREFMDDESTLDAEYGLEEYDLEDRLIYHKRKKNNKKKVKTLNIEDHIKILQEFVEDLERLTHDSKAGKLLSILSEIFQYSRKEKVLIFTQFKQTLFYLATIIRAQGIEVTEFHGDLTENQKNQAVHLFKTSVPVMLSTEIGGEGRNFQFCHIIVNYDLPWNPMRLEQRIGRLDRIGQSHNVIIYNFFIRDTVESSIVLAIMERIHLFEQSIGSLEPILGSLEDKITNLILNEESTDPIKYQLEDVISKTDTKIEKITDELDDFILDRRSFQRHFLTSYTPQNQEISDIDLFRFFQIFEKFSHSKFSKLNLNVEPFNYDFHLNIVDKPGEMGVWHLHYSEELRQELQLPYRNLEGVFRLDLAQTQEEYDFLALGHPLLMNLADYVSNDLFSGNISILPVHRNVWASHFQPPYAARLTESEIEPFQRILKASFPLHLFIFEVEFVGIIVEKLIIPLVLSDEGDIFPSLGLSFQKIHVLAEIVDESFKIFEQKGNSLAAQQESFRSQVPAEKLQQLLTIAQEKLKLYIQPIAQRLIASNKQAYFKQVAKTKRMIALQEKFATQQYENAKLTLRTKKLKLPTERQLQNVEAINDPHKKAARLQDFANRKKQVNYYEHEVLRWERILDSLAFDLPATLARLKKHRQLWIDAQLLGYSGLSFF